MRNPIMTPVSKAQQGMATLTMSLVVLFLASLMVFYTSSGMLFEIKTGNNQLHQTKALEAARGGVEHTMASLAIGSAAKSLIWSPVPVAGEPPVIQTATLSNPELTIGDYKVALSVQRSSDATTILEVIASASGEANSSNVATNAVVRQKIRLGTTTVPESKPKTLNIATVAPIVIKGQLLEVTGNPDVYPSTIGGVAIATSSTNSSDIQIGHLDLNGGTISYGAFTGDAWDFVFPNTTKAQMKAAADYQKIYFYDGTVAPPDPWHQSLGTASDPVILIFDAGAGCPKINGQVVIYGLVYFANACVDNGWGGVEIHGSMVADGTITKLNANAEFTGWSVSSGTGVITLPPTIENVTKDTFAKLAASWRDF